MSVSELERQIDHDMPSAQDTSRERPTSIAGVVLGTLVGLANEGRTALVLYPGQPTDAAVVARSTVCLSGAHIGQQVALMFDGAEPGRPIIMGWIRQELSREEPVTIDVDIDGAHLTVSAKEQLVLRCGRASITLTKAGKVLIQGDYVSTRSSGLNRIRGGSVQIN